MSAEAGAGRGGKPDTLPAVGPLGELGLSRWVDGSASPTTPAQLCLLPHLSGVYHPWGSGSPGLGWMSSMEPPDIPS